MSSRKMTGARFIAETLKGYGVTHVFFVPAILRQTLVEMETVGIHRVLTHTEKAAAYMADGYARASRKPGICMAQSVGAANLAAGLQDAYLGLSPVIAFTGRKAPVARYRHAYQEIIHRPLFEPVTKFNAEVDSIDQLPFLLRQAFREATSAAPGPVHLDTDGYQGDITEASELTSEIVVESNFARYPSNRPLAEPEMVKEAVKLLGKAKRPVIVAGGGATASGAGEEIVKLAEMLSIPVATSLNGKGSILEDHPLSIGVVGTYSRWCANRVVSEADLVLFIGSHTGDQVTNNWTIPGTGTPIIQIDIDPCEPGRSYPGCVALMGDAKKTVHELIRHAGAQQNRDEWIQHARGLVEEWRVQIKPLYCSDATPIRPERLCKEIGEWLPPDAILVVDTGYSGIWTGTLIELKHPYQRYIRAAGSLGWAFPASLGAKCGAPERPVICFTGDGGFWYHLSELETAVRCSIRTVTIVNNNDSLGQCLKGVDLAYGDRPGNKDELFCFGSVSFARIAEEMGCCGIRVTQPDQIAGALRDAQCADRPVVVEVVTDPQAKAPEPWTPQ
ncbi:MAG: thiamine pyrophosphate-binding protein [Deltaproteobacteria bacterium]|nr:thiamine pyrophosphate-binding protein [Deltaproteobacteria bacterium]